MELKEWNPDGKDLLLVDDLIQSGVVGLIEAMQKFNSNQGASFETYAGIRIRGSMLDEIRKGDWTPRSVYRKSRAVSDAINQVESKLGREARDEEIAEQIFDFTKNTVLVGFNIRLAYALLKNAFRPTPFRFQRQHLGLKMLIEQRFDTASTLEEKPKSKSLGGLCRHFGLKYDNTYNLKKRAKTIHDY